MIPEIPIQFLENPKPDIRPFPLMANQIEADRVIARVCAEWRFRQRLKPWTGNGRPQDFIIQRDPWFISSPMPRLLFATSEIREASMEIFREMSREELRRCSSTEEQGDSTPLVAGSTPATAAKDE